MKSVQVSNRPDALPGLSEELIRRRVSRRWLVNALNRANFQDAQVLLTFRHAASGATLSVPAHPGPCVNQRLSCSWVRKPPLADHPAGWELRHLHLTDGMAQFEVSAHEGSWDDLGASLALPDSAFDISSRRSRRHSCRGVGARVTLGGESFQGQLISSSATSFSVRLKPGATTPPNDAAVDVALSRGATALFTGPCTVIRTAPGRGSLTLALRPLVAARPEEAPTRYRSLRPHIAPLPLIVFRHPLTGRQVTLRAIDISGAGFSVEEEASRAQLLPGLLLPRVRIEVTSGFDFPCSARVVYNEPTPDGGLRSGLAIQAMSLRDHTRLTSLLHLGEYRNTSVCTPHVDLEELWGFFFESGFIYPDKYRHIKDQKAHFMRLYRKLYNRTPRIARHIIYQERGAIHGHVSMFRWYPSTWILHHHAAITSPRHKAGLVVMEHMLRYIKEFHQIFPLLIRYIICYFRPNNRFAARAFGGAAHSMMDPRGCSLDAFAYFHLPAGVTPAALPRGWTLDEAGAGDRAALREIYALTSGGLMIEGLALREEDREAEAALSREFARLGFKRDRRLFALRRGTRCLALIAVNLSDTGLNLSDLTNGLQAFVLAPDELPGSVLLGALAALSAHYPSGRATVLLYPRAYADAHHIAYDKVYDLTVLDVEHLGPYLNFMEELIAPAHKAHSASSTSG